MDVILISGHSGVLDQSRLFLNDRTYVVTYGKCGENNYTSEFVNLQKAFFENRLPRDVDNFKEIIPSLSIIPDKKFKLHNKMYHDMEIILCTYGFVDADGEECSEEASSYARVYLSGVFLMGNPPPPYYNRYISIRPTVDLNGKKKYMVPRYVASDIYINSVFPTPEMLDEMFLKTLKNGKINKRLAIPLHELISKTRTTLSEIIDIFKSVVPTIFLVEGCREYRGNDLEDRLASSNSEKSSEQSNESDEVVVDQPFLAYEPPLKSAQLPNVDDKVFKTPTGIQKIKSSRIKGKKGDSLVSLVEKKGSKTKGPRSKGVFDSLLNAGKKTRKKRKNKRK